MKFKFNDKVKVIDGFYTGVKGVVTNHALDKETGHDKHTYIILYYDPNEKYDKHTWIEEEYLSLR